uniref:Uncharacterized protein n=1 Tax=Anopheles coluzzii TaxID=1518534 RepID=A0A8W7PV91_ANOCL
MQKELQHESHRNGMGGAGRLREPTFNFKHRKTCSTIELWSAPGVWLKLGSWVPWEVGKLYQLTIRLNGALLDAGKIHSNCASCKCTPINGMLVNCTHRGAYRGDAAAEGLWVLIFHSSRIQPPAPQTKALGGVL